MQPPDKEAKRGEDQFQHVPTSNPTRSQLLFFKSANNLELLIWRLNYVMLYNSSLLWQPCKQTYHIFSRICRELLDRFWPIFFQFDFYAGQYLVLYSAQVNTKNILLKDLFDLSFLTSTFKFCIALTIIWSFFDSLSFLSMVKRSSLFHFVGVTICVKGTSYFLLLPPSLQIVLILNFKLSFVICDYTSVFLCLNLSTTNICNAKSV